jgi:replication-associated recombination protein RarA
MGIIPPTVNGYNYLEVVSTLQKAIRRGDESTALFFSTEVIMSGKDEALWRRLKVITSEDVGLATLSAPAIVESLHAAYKEAKKQKKDSKPERLMIMHAVVFLCRCKKSRLVDWVVNAYFPNHGENLMPIPDYAFDMHTSKGRKLGRNLKHFVEEGAKLKNHSKLPLEDHYRNIAIQELEKKKKRSMDKGSTINFKND